MKQLLFALLFLPLAGFSQQKKDTLDIPAHVKVIRIDGVLYDVVRTTELKKKETDIPFNWGGLKIYPNNTLRVDTTYNTTPLGRSELLYIPPKHNK